MGSGNQGGELGSLGRKREEGQHGSNIKARPGEAGRIEELRDKGAEARLQVSERWRVVVWSRKEDCPGHFLK